jgi:hypothetical protein
MIRGAGKAGIKQPKHVYPFVPAVEKHEIERFHIIQTFCQLPLRLSGMQFYGRTRSFIVNPLGYGSKLMQGFNRSTLDPGGVGTEVKGRNPNGRTGQQHSLWFEIISQTEKERSFFSCNGFPPYDFGYRRFRLFSFSSAQIGIRDRTVVLKQPFAEQLNLLKPVKGVSFFNHFGNQIEYKGRMNRVFSG